MTAKLCDLATGENASSTPDGSDRWELVEGTPEAMAPSHPRHGATVTLESIGFSAPLTAFL